MITPLAAGSPAPDVSLLDQNGESISLSDLKGKESPILLLPKSNDARVYCSSSRSS